MTPPAPGERPEVQYTCEISIGRMMERPMCRFDPMGDTVEECVAQGIILLTARLGKKAPLTLLVACSDLLRMK